jgi:hypothetical protein
MFMSSSVRASSAGSSSRPWKNSCCLSAGTPSLAATAARTSPMVWS